MARRSMKSALGSSLDAESQAFQTRLAKADRVLENSATDKSKPNETKASGEIVPAVASAPTVAEPTVKIVREAFTLPENEQEQIEAIRERALRQAVFATKSEVMRAGLLLVSELNDQELTQVLERVEKVRTGRPKSQR